MKVINLTYEEKKDIYRDNFTLGYLGNDINKKFTLLSLVCLVTYLAKQKDPDATPYSMLKKINKGDTTLPDSFIHAIAIQCEDLMYGCESFPTFGVPNKEIISTIKKLLNEYLPF